MLKQTSFQIGAYSRVCGLSQQMPFHTSSNRTGWSNRVSRWRIVLSWMIVWLCFFNTPKPLLADDGEGVANTTQSGSQSLEQLKSIGRSRSKFLVSGAVDTTSLGNSTSELGKLPEPKLEEFQATIAPILKDKCVECHGPETQEGNVRIDTLDSNLHVGKDVQWWTEILAVVSKGEMPPSDSPSLTDQQRTDLMTWLSSELHAASIARRQSASQSVFRRMTRYEFNYAMQDLLGLPWDFAKDLPPEAKSSEGFRNTADQLGMSVTQLETFHRLSRQALERATVQGELPARISWGIPMQDLSRLEWPKQEQQIEKLRKEHKEDEAKLKAELEKLEQSFTKPLPQTYFRNLDTGRIAASHWEYYEAKYAIAPKENLEPPPSSIQQIAVIPTGKWLNIELGNKLPDTGTLLVRVRANRGSNESPAPPSLQLHFGWQASNEGRALMRVSQLDHVITATSGAAEFYQWTIPLGEIYPRNSVRRTSPMGATPSPSEYIRLVNSSASTGDIEIDYVEVQAPVYDQWPPASHRRIFFESDNSGNEMVYAREVIAKFMRRAWRRNIDAEELDHKMRLFSQLRKDSTTFEEAVIETLATVLASPKFLYLVQAQQDRSSDGLSASSGLANDSHSRGRTKLNAGELATRLSMFLWCSLPDDELLDLATSGKLLDPETLAQQVERMLTDVRSQRFAKEFVHQWLDLELLDFLNFQQHVPRFDPLLKEAMQHEPVALFSEVLRNNESVLNFLHADYVMANERLAHHYGIGDVYGNEFRRIPVKDGFRRGGLLTQAGVLSMNADYPDSHPLKRGKWILVSLLNDPPPPPPPAVPQIDLTNPEIAKMTLKERIVDHRNHPACYACHMKIDPWGIAFENYDALGKWRDNIGEKPVDASSELANSNRLEGMDGLKRYLLENRQDQFVSALTHKLMTYALGRSLKFADQADLDEVAEKVRRRDDGLKTLISAIVASELFQTK